MSDEPYDWTEHVTADQDRTPIWKPVEIGAKIEGAVSEIWTYVDKVKETRTPVLTIDTGEGLESVWASQVLLRQALADQDPQVGDRVSIEFVGVRPTKSGSGMMKEFDVVVSKPVAKRAVKPKPDEEPPDDHLEDPF